MQGRASIVTEPIVKETSATSSEAASPGLRPMRCSRRAGGDWIRVTLTGNDESLALANAEEAFAPSNDQSKLAAKIASVSVVVASFVRRTAMQSSGGGLTLSGGT